MLMGASVLEGWVWKGENPRVSRAAIRRLCPASAGIFDTRIVTYSERGNGQKACPRTGLLMSIVQPRVARAPPGIPAAPSIPCPIPPPCTSNSGFNDRCISHGSSMARCLFQGDRATDARPTTTTYRDLRARRLGRGPRWSTLM